LKWKFDDPESGLKEYRFYIQDFYQGQSHKFYPQGQGYVTIPVINNNITADIVLQNLNMTSGHKYSVKVTAINHADMPQSQESDGVIIDSSPPVLKKVYTYTVGDLSQFWLSCLGPLVLLLPKL
jgi:hypothetical protein